jgi:hypothetical protein
MPIAEPYSKIPQQRLSDSETDEPEFIKEMQLYCCRGFIMPYDGFTEPLAFRWERHRHVAAGTIERSNEK